MGLTSGKAERRLVAYVPEWLYEKVVYEATVEGQKVSELLRTILYERYGYTHNGGYRVNREVGSEAGYLEQLRAKVQGAIKTIWSKEANDEDEGS